MTTVYEFLKNLTAVSLFSCSIFLVTFAVYVSLKALYGLTLDPRFKLKSIFWVEIFSTV
jgi:hypothetical protein